MFPMLCRLIMEWTEEGEKYIKEAPEGSHTFCSFVGKVAVGRPLKLSPLLLVVKLQKLIEI